MTFRILPGRDDTLGGRDDVIRDRDARLRGRDRILRGRDRILRGRDDDPRWARPALLGLLLAVGLAYLWNLSASGYANSFYSAAVQAGSQSWKAMFFGSLDSAGAITVDKPPASLWPMALSVRIFGLSSWAILVPQVLMGVATAGVLYAAVRRRFSAGAGLLSVVVFALTPVAALMFRFNNPDALLALLMTVTVYCVLRAMEHGRTKWLVWAGVAIGLAFLTKTLQAFLILPALAVVYGVFAPGRPLRRIGQLLLSGAVTVVAGGWWVAVVELWPKSSRPYIGGSQTNSFLELTFGYNGLGRISGDETGSVGGGGTRGGAGHWGSTGLGRMFGAEVGSQVSWLLPAALLLLVAGVVITWRAGRTDTARAAFLAWGGSLIMSMAVFSFMAGIFHQYYTVALAPYAAALVGMGVSVLWQERARFAASATLGLTVAVTAVWSYVLLGRTPDYVPWLRWAILVGGVVAGLGVALAGRVNRQLTLGAAGLGLAAALAGPAAYTVSTLGTGHNGSIVTAGPAGASMRGGFGGGFRAGGMRPPGVQAPPNTLKGRTLNNRTPNGLRNSRHTMGGGMSGLLDGARVSAKAKALVAANADHYTWAAATVGAQNAAGYQLSTGKPVMAIGGFNGSDPSPTLAQFKRYVEDGRIHYFIAGGRDRMGGGRGGTGGGRGGRSGAGTAASIQAWVEKNYTKVTVGTATFYDLTRPTA
ncbi:glycosyltransferase family 39 protein [Streptomyces sp. NPDC046821]|uniref:glycosyltransferase family 39 protein n=1 Tax=Streptomyces sp. NPDC046821 TaxID=3154702 RepID=UPI00340F9141